MKHRLAFGLLLLTCNCVAQNDKPAFRLTDTAFSVGAVYHPTCDIIFDFDGHNEVRSESFACLDSFADFMLQHPGIIVEIGSHTDQRGSDTFNIKLSQSRANSVMKYLLAQGISSANVAAVGYGETELIVSNERIKKARDKNESEELHQQNRRIEFKILHMYEATFTPVRSTFI